MPDTDLEGYCGHRFYGYARYVETTARGLTILSKAVEGSKHKLKYPRPAWAIQANIVRYHLNDVDYFEVVDVEENVGYRVSPKEFMEHAYPIERGSGDQLALPLSYWAKFKSENLAFRQLGMKL